MKLLHTKYGYITNEEAKIDSDLDKWCREKRNTQNESKQRTNRFNQTLRKQPKK